MNTNKENTLEKLKDKTLALFFTTGVSLKTWHEIGMLDREVAIYNELSKYFKHIYFFTYGGEEDLKFKSYLADNITVIPKKYISNSFLYSFLIPVIHRKILRDIDILKTNQMRGSWSAVLTKLIYRKKLVVRTGYMLSIDLAKENPKSGIRWIMISIERIAYRFADGIITSSPTNFEYVEKNYNPFGIHVLIPNYVEAEIFKPINPIKKKGSICFVGRLNQEKNLFALLEALKGLPYTFTIIGSGEQEEQLKNFANKNKVNANFLGNIPNHELPKILNQHEIFILPSSRGEGMPKTLLEAMACGLPVIGTNVKGINEVIEHGKNGILCNTDADSIREPIIKLMEDEELKQKLGENARRTIVENYSLDNLAERELELMEELI
jgi:glycosyltransferase involved in cell wall biosynthesis